MQLSYGKHPLQKYKIFQQLDKNKKTLLLIHGGAWNDTNNTCFDFKELVENLTGQQNLRNYNIFGINYRLTPEVVHPAHLVDVATCIKAIMKSYGPTSFSIVGHSVGATMVLQLLNFKQILANGLRESAPDIDLDFDFPKIQFDFLFFIDGIYDIKDLVAEYGGPYRDFVERAFVSETQYTEAVQTSWTDFTNFELYFKNLIVIQSKEDELLSLRQTHGFLAFLQKFGVTYEYSEKYWGKHEEVYRRSEVAALIAEKLRNN